MSNKSFHVIDEELIEQMYRAIKGLNDGLTEVYRHTEFQAQLIKDLQARVHALENNNKKT